MKGIGKKNFMKKEKSMAPSGASTQPSTDRMVKASKGSDKLAKGQATMTAGKPSKKGRC